MPGSLLSPPRTRVARNESTRSDHSDGSNTSQSSAAGKKVSFSKAVRVKKYSRPKKVENGDLHTNGNGVTHGSTSPEKRFWFRVYKNKHRQAPDPKELKGNDVIYYDNNIGTDVIRYNEHGDIVSYNPNPSPLNYPVLTYDCGTQTRTGPTRTDYEPTKLHPSQMPIEPPHVKRNHVKKIVHRFNEEASFSRQKPSEGSISPPDSPRMYSTHHKTQRIPTPPPEPPSGYSSSYKAKKHPLFNGVKVMFGLGNPNKKKEKDFVTRTDGKDYSRRSDDELDIPRYSPMPNGHTRISERYPYKTEVVLSDGSDTELKSPYEERLERGESKRNHYNRDLVPTRHGGLFRHDEEGNGEYNDYYHQNGEDDSKRGKCHVETFDSGNQLVFDTTDITTSNSKVDKGELFTTVGEKHEVWQNNRRMIVVEEQSPKIIRRKTKSHTDLSHSRDDSLVRDRQSRVDKGVSTEHLSGYDDKHSKRSKDSWFKLWRTTTRDKGIQCNEVPSIDEIDRQNFYTTSKYKVMHARNGFASAYTNTPSLDKTDRVDSNHLDEYNSSIISSSFRNGDIYSQVDKSKKKKSEKKKVISDDRNNGSLFKARSEPLFIGPPPKGYRNDDYGSSYYDDGVERHVKSSKRSFGFHLNPGGKDKKADKFKEDNWYNVDDDLDSASKIKSRNQVHHDMSEIRQDIAHEEFPSDMSSSGERNGDAAGSVMREVDFKKREISYENVPRSDGDHNHNSVTVGGSGMWFRDADEDYRKEMAQNEVSYPAGSHVGSDRFYTVNRTDRSAKQKPPSSPRAFTLDRRHMKDKSKTSNSGGVKILVNGKEVGDKATFKKNKSRKSRYSGEDPSSVQSDPLYVRGGLAAAYQARQRAAVRRSNSSVAGMSSNYRTVSPVVRRKYRGTSDVSGASSETEVAHSRKPLVMYIPGISHPERSPDDDDRSSGVNVVRSQSMMTSQRPPKITPRASKPSHKSSKQDLYRNNELYGEDEIMPLASDSSKKKPPKVPQDSRRNSDIKRRHTMPKDTKFPWLKWRIRSKPSREP